MSAPDTNVKKQEKEHKGPLMGMGAAIIWAVVLLAALMAWIVFNGNDPEGAETQIDGRTGQVEAPDGTPTGETPEGTAVTEQ